MRHFFMRLMCLVLLGCFPLLARTQSPEKAAGAQAVESSPKKQDELPQFAIGRVGSLAFRHNSFVNSIAYAESHDQLITAGGDNVIRVWNRGTGELQYQVPVAAPGPVPDLVLGGVSWVSMLGNSSLVCAASQSMGTVVVLDLDKKEIVKSLNEDMLTFFNFIAASTSADGRYLVTANKNALTQVVKIWETKTWTKVATIENFKKQVSDVALTPDGKTLVVATHDGVLPFTSGDKTIQLFRASDGKPLERLEGHPSPAMFLAIRKDSKLLASVHPGHVCIWDLGSRKLLQTHRVETLISPIGFLRRLPIWSADSKSLFVSGRGLFKVDVESNKVEKQAVELTGSGPLAPRPTRPHDCNRRQIANSVLDSRQGRRSYYRFRA